MRARAVDCRMRQFAAPIERAGAGGYNKIICEEYFWNP
jgi:hypothetical protein